MPVQIPNTNPGKNEQRGLEIIFTEEKETTETLLQVLLRKPWLC